MLMAKGVSQFNLQISQKENLKLPEIMGDELRGDTRAFKRQIFKRKRFKANS